MRSTIKCTGLIPNLLSGPSGKRSSPEFSKDLVITNPTASAQTSPPLGSLLRPLKVGSYSFSTSSTHSTTSIQTHTQLAHTGCQWSQACSNKLELRGGLCFWWGVEKTSKADKTVRETVVRTTDMTQRKRSQLQGQRRVKESCAEIQLPELHLSAPLQELISQNCECPLSCRGPRVRQPIVAGWMAHSSSPCSPATEATNKGDYGKP